MFLLFGVYTNACIGSTKLAIKADPFLYFLTIKTNASYSVAN